MTGDMMVTLLARHVLRAYGMDDEEAGFYTILRFFRLSDTFSRKTIVPNYKIFTGTGIGSEK